jgi:hypothetical protein
LARTVRQVVQCFWTALKNPMVVMIHIISPSR